MQGSNEIPSKQIGYVLRILGQNPTEDDIVEMVMKVSIRLSTESEAQMCLANCKLSIGFHNHGEVVAFSVIVKTDGSFAALV